MFREEARAQAQILSDGLLALERAPRDPVTLEACMRAAHSLKGAARIVGVPVGVSLAHVMEDCFVGAQQGRVSVDAAMIDVLLAGVDLIVRIGQASGDETVPQTDVDAFVGQLNARMNGAARRAISMPSFEAPLVGTRLRSVEGIDARGAASLTNRNQMRNPSPYSFNRPAPPSCANRPACCACAPIPSTAC